MDQRINKYAKILSDDLEEYVNDRKQREDITYQFVKDTEHHQYQILRMAWIKGIFRSDIIFHFEIKSNGKLWLWVNNTDIVVTEDLIDRGIPKSDIVLGFHAPEVRAYTGYAVG